MITPWVLEVDDPLYRVWKVKIRFDRVDTWITNMVLQDTRYISSFEKIDPKVDFSRHGLKAREVLSFPRPFPLRETKSSYNYNYLLDYISTKNLDLSSIFYPS